MSVLARFGQVWDRTEEVIRHATRILRHEVRSKRNSIDLLRLRNMLTEYAEIGGIHLNAVPHVLLHAKRNIIIVRHFVVDIEALRVTWRQSAGRLQKCTHISVVSDGCEDSRKIVHHVTPLTQSGIVQDGRAAADRSLAIAEYVIGEAETRSPQNAWIINKSARKILVARSRTTWNRIANAGDKQPDVGLGEKRARKRILRITDPVLRNRGVQRLPLERTSLGES